MDKLYEIYIPTVRDTEALATTLIHVLGYDWEEGCALLRNNKKGIAQTVSAHLSDDQLQFLKFMLDGEQITISEVEQF